MNQFNVTSTRVEYAETMEEMGIKADKARDEGANEVFAHWEEKAKVYVIEYEIPKVE